MDCSNNPRRTVLICVLLAAITLAVYWPVLRNGFVSYDDPYYVTENPHVLGGLSWGSVAWAFRTNVAGNWHPLTLLSHLLDVQLFGLKAAGHHLTSLLIHIANTVLLFLVLRRLVGMPNGTKGGEHPTSNIQHPTSNIQHPTSNICAPAASDWLCAFVAALFALHPLHVESVAWVAERKDVLSGFFFLLTLWAYVQYVKAKGLRLKAKGSADHGPRTTDHKSRFTFHVSTFYLLSLTFFALGLMSKPMLVTVPFVLLLLDYWPLGRMQNGEQARAANAGGPETAPPASRFTFHVSRPARKSQIVNRIWEKVPFFLLSLAACVVTLQTQQQIGATHSLEAMPMGFRVANAVISYVRYPAKMLWPSGLAVFYPAPAAWPVEEVLGAALLLAGVTAGALWRLKRAPYLAVGWFWYVGMLVPVIGLVQVGSQAMADRYTYLPLIGLLVMAVWSAAEIPLRWPAVRPWVAAGGVAVLGACAVLTWQQLAGWKSSITLYEHALAVTSRNVLAHNNLGACLVDGGNVTGGEAHFAEAVRLRPRYQEALINLGLCQELQGRTNEALAVFERAAEVEPNPRAEYSLGRLLSQRSQAAEAESHLRTALKLKPEFAEAWCELGSLHARQGLPEVAAQDCAAALRVKPTCAPAHLLLGTLLGEQKKFEEALAQFNAVLGADPANADAHYNIGLLLNARGDFAGAAAHYAEAARLRPGDVDTRQNLALALLFQGKLAEAAAQFEAVLRARPDATAHYYLALALDGQGQPEEAVAHYREAIRLDPKAPLYLNDLAWLLATSPREQARNGAEAVRLAEEACRLSGGKVPRFWGTLDAAYAEAGRFADAVAAATKTRELALAAGQPDIANAAEARRELYRAGKPYRSR